APAQPPLLLTTISAGMLCRTSVSISIPFIPNDPSPLSTITCVLGLATFAPKPNGTATPMQPLGPAFTRCPAECVGIDWRRGCRRPRPGAPLMALRGQQIPHPLL